MIGSAKIVFGLAVLFALETYLLPDPRFNTLSGIIARVIGILTLWALGFALAVWLVHFFNHRRVRSRRSTG